MLRLLALCALLLVLLALYVSLGRLLIPLVSNYAPAIEQQLSQRFSAPVRMGAVEGRWNRLNPGLSLQQVQLMAPVSDAATEAEPQTAVLIDRMSLELDVLASLRQWRVVLENVGINGMVFDFLQQPDGRWQLVASGQAAAARMELAQVFDIASRFDNLELRDTLLNFRFQDGSHRILSDGTVRFQSQGQQHYLHLDGSWDDSPAPLSLSAELHGQSFQDLSGMLHLQLPAGDYTALLAGRTSGGWHSEAASGAAQLWAGLAGGRLSSLHAELDMSRLVLHREALNREEAAVLDLGNLHTRVAARPLPSGDGWELVLQDTGFDWRGSRWPPSNIRMNWQDNGRIEVSADALDVGIAASLFGTYTLLPDPAQEALQELDPRGMLERLQLSAFVEDGQVQNLTAAANMGGVNIGAYVGAPAIWGLHGYAELVYQAAEQKLSGFAEVDSSELMLHLPKLFHAPWSYTHVNGRVSYDINLASTLNLRLASSVIHAESDIIDGRARFSVDYSRNQEGERSSTLELMVGALRADASQKHHYLPLAADLPAGIQGVMNWVDAAVQGGEVGSSGLIWRGSVLGGAPRASRTLQMFYNVKDGQLEFDPAWPALEKLSGLVVIDDGRVDVSASGGESLGIRLDSSTARVQHHAEAGGNWLTVSGRGAAAAQDGLHYLQQTPVTRGFGSYLANWRAEGEVDMNLQLSIPLGIAGAMPAIDLALTMQGNTLQIPDQDLHISDIGGRLTYRQNKAQPEAQEEGGLSSEGLTASLFGGVADVKLSSPSAGAELPGVAVRLEGRADVEALAQWSGHSALQAAVLQRAAGVMDYTADFTVNPAGNQPGSSRLRLASDLQAVDLDFPAPLGKDAGTALPFSLDLEWGGTAPRLRTELRGLLSADLQMRPEGGVERGLVLLGPRDESLPIRRFNGNAPGLEVLGQLAYINADEWMDLLPESQFPVAGAGGSGARSLNSLFSLADVQLAELTLAGQTINRLNIQLSSSQSALDLVVASEQIAGHITLPHAADLPIEVRLDYLRLPGAEDESALAGAGDAADQLALEEPRQDPLAAVDPREFPTLHFSTQELSIGVADYGQWQLSSKPVPGGVEFSDVIISARGLHLGSEGQGATVLWHYDGAQHQSSLRGQLAASNMGTVLTGFGYAPSLESGSARFDADLNWPGSPANLSAVGLSGAVDLKIQNGRFLQGDSSTGSSALKLISILNFDALMRRLRFSDDLTRSGLAYDEINGSLAFDEGTVTIVDRLQIIGPSSLFQIRGSVDLREETIDGNMYITLPVSDNIPWLGGLAALNNLINWQVAIGVFIIDRIFGEQVDNLTSAQYVLKGPWEGLEPKLSQVFTSGGPRTGPADVVQEASSPALDSGASAGSAVPESSHE